MKWATAAQAGGCRCLSSADISAETCPLSACCCPLYAGIFLFWRQYRLWLTPVGRLSCRVPLHRF